MGEGHGYYGDVDGGHQKPHGSSSKY